jgi:hypothetical protein
VAHEGITDDVRKREEDYFRQRDRELLEKMRKAAAADQARKDLGQAIGVHDQELLAELEGLGFTPDTIRLLPIVPVLQVAWAEGGVSAAERKMLVDLARARGISEGSPADLKLTEWMERHPSAETFRKAGRLITALLEQHAGGNTEIDPDDLIRYCEGIAAASGGFFGIGKVSAEERAALEQIAGQLKKRT